MENDRINNAFDSSKNSGRKVLIGYLTAGDPDLETSEGDIRCALEGGVDILELGVPFSDPIADGPVIQAASRRALDSGVTPAEVLRLVERLRIDFSQPIILFGYLNPFLAYGFEKLCRDASRAGVDGLLIVDLSFEESRDIKAVMKSHGLSSIPLIAPTTSKKRAGRILREAEGFVYYIMVRGVTGARTRLATDLERHIALIRSCTDLPIAAGFGVGSGKQAREVARWADGVVVGSALIENARQGRLSSFLKELRRALSGDPD